ncbi:MAG TPA: cell division protein ZapA, partial [Flavobacteriaceae bacterium]|nr:cell division protein ZapA [Flavobacteriaceae bacterium]
YPLTIHPSQEEGLRKASQEINNMIKQFEENYSVRDKQDALAMCALQIASIKSKKTINELILNKALKDKLFHLNKLLKEV